MEQEGCGICVRACVSVRISFPDQRQSRDIDVKDDRKVEEGKKGGIASPLLQDIFPLLDYFPASLCAYVHLSRNELQ